MSTLLKDALNRIGEKKSAINKLTREVREEEAQLVAAMTEVGLMHCLKPNYPLLASELRALRPAKVE